MQPPPFPHQMVSRARQIRHDPVLGHAFVPGLRTRVPHEHGAYFVVTNAQGFREDHDLERPPAGFHVVCFGDSYAAGDGVDNHERFSSLLGERLGITVTNVAVPGHGPDQNLLQLEHLALPRADLILWCVAVHTIERIQSSRRITIDRHGRLWSMPRPYFVLTTEDALELRNVPVAEVGEPLPEDPPRLIRMPFAARCADMVWRVRARAVATLGPFLKSEPDPEYRDRNGPEWRLLAAIVQRFHVAASGIPVAIVPLPTARYVQEPLTPHFLERFRELERREAGLHVLDVLSGLRRFPRAETRGLHYRLDGHFTREGHAAVADALVAEALRLQLAPGDRQRPASESAGLDSHVSSRARRFTLHVGWTLDDGFARLSERDAMLAEHRETLLVGHPCRPGVVPLSAVNASLEDAGVAGPELVELVLWSPCQVAELAGCQLEDSRTLLMASGLVRWFGAAARDLRKFLNFTGPIREEFAAAATNRAEDLPRLMDSSPLDDELSWMWKQLLSVPRGLTVDALVRRLRRLGRQWELATREAREAVLPTTAPLRRGRIAARIARQPRP